ncbi:MAG: LysM peptidoglycan-binding domain-containing protein [Treponemataceae bacterium]
MKGGKIGIRLADDKFYGILEAFATSKKKLELEFVDTGKSAIEIEVFYLNEKSVPHQIKTISVDNLKKFNNIYTIILSLGLNERGFLSCTLQDKHSEAQSHFQLSFFDYIKNQQTPYIKKPLKTKYKKMARTSKQGLDSFEIEAIFSDCAYTSYKRKLLLNFAPLAVSCVCVIISLLTLIFTVAYSKKSKQTIATLSLPTIASNIDELELNFMHEFQMYSPYKNEFSNSNFKADDEKLASNLSSPLAPISVNKQNYLSAQENKIIISDSKTIIPQAPERIPVEKNMRYRIFWGDTLLDISAAYYRTPWLYQYIADHNEIKNTDYIIAGKWIVIPAK